MTQKAWIIQRPATGRYTPDVLALQDYEAGAPDEGEVLVRPLLLSLDPSNLMWLKLQPGWMETVKIGDVMKGPGLSLVLASKANDIEPGTLVYGPVKWADRAVVPAGQIFPVEHEAGVPLSTFLTIFSHVGQAAMIGMRWLGDVKAGDTVLVSAAAGATGMLACEIARASGARVIGIAGGPAKCRVLSEDIGIEHAIDYRNQDVVAELRRICPEGPNLFFDNVGGELLDSLIPHMAVHGRIVICGQISEYSHGTPGEGYRFRNLFYLLMRRLRMEGFVVPDFAGELPVINKALDKLYRDGKITDRPHLLDGIEKAADGLEMLLTGGNTGKLMVQVSSL